MKLKAKIFIIADTYVMPNGERVIVGEVINESISISNGYDQFALSDPDMSEPQHIDFKAMHKDGNLWATAEVGETVHLTMTKYFSDNLNVEKGMILSKRKLKIWEGIIITIFKGL